MHKYIATINDINYEVELLRDGGVLVNGEPYEVDFEHVTGNSVYSLIVNGRSFETHIYEDEDALNILMRGDLYAVRVEDEREKRLKDAAGIGGESGNGFVLKSPMPGLVVKVQVAVGDTVEKGDVLLILESMKMQNELKTPMDGTIKSVSVKDGDSVEQRQIMIEVE